MRTLAHRVRRAGIVLLVVGAGAFGIASPAVAEPVTPAPAEETCSDPLDGVTVCYELIQGETPSESTVTATVRAEEGRTLDGVLVAVEGCSPDCHVLEVVTGQDVSEISATAPYGRGNGYHRANASWVDDQGRLHAGVTAE